ncbi:MAG TPA: hypothetical protein DDW52_04725 [Planctomycetaceae bacterium]|nr:hypothetical protein [Planctomycetaceae bacterium]
MDRSSAARRAASTGPRACNPSVALALAVGTLICSPAGCQEASSRDADPEASANELLIAANRFLNQEKFSEVPKLSEKAASLESKSPRVQQRVGELLYLSGHAKQSLQYFDRAIELEPELAARNWQRGLALATIGKFAEGARQFKIHHVVNPDDVENTAWYFLCVAKSKGVEAAQASIIPSRGDPREPMMSILAMYRGELDPAKVIEAAKANSRTETSRRQALMYAQLYIGLYYDSLGKRKEAAKHLKDCMAYGLRGYMADTARVYYNDRIAKVKQDDKSPDK